MLELFEGKISLTEILSLDTNRLYGLFDAKVKLNEEKAKKAAEQAQAQMAAMNDPSKI